MTAPATLEQVLEVLRAKRPEARALGIELVGVVGSIARGEAGPDSDVDVVYERIGPLTLFGLARLAGSLEHVLDRRVDLVRLESVRPLTRSRMAKDLVAA